jgi:hypothetical protein
MQLQANHPIEALTGFNYNVMTNNNGFKTVTPMTTYAPMHPNDPLKQPPPPSSKLPHTTADYRFDTSAAALELLLRLAHAFEPPLTFHRDLPGT